MLGEKNDGTKKMTKKVRFFFALPVKWDLFSLLTKLSINARPKRITFLS